MLYYHEFLQPKSFLIKTDNSALKYLDFVKHITGRLGRWHMLLSGYKYRIEHIKESKNIVADTLSQIDLPTESEDTENLDDKVANINSISDVTLNEGMILDGDDLVHDRSNHVWAITLNRPTSDKSADNDDKLYNAEMRTDDDLDNMLSPYDVQQLQEP